MNDKKTKDIKKTSKWQTGRWLVVEKLVEAKQAQGG